MQARLRTHPHLEYRPSGFHWRRRWPRRILATISPETRLRTLSFSLRTHVIPEAKALAHKLTLLSDLAFAGMTERRMGIAPEIMDSLLAELCRFLIESADVARETAPPRTPEVAAYETACANAAIDSLRAAITTRDREPARDPLREVAARLGVALDEEDADWARLAFRALRVMLDAEEENIRRDQGVFDRPSPATQAARHLVDAGPAARPRPAAPAAAPAARAPCPPPAAAPGRDPAPSPSATSSRPSSPPPSNDARPPQAAPKAEPWAVQSPEPARARPACPT